MRSLIAEPDKSGNSIKVTPLSRSKPRSTNSLIQIKINFNQAPPTTNIQDFRETTQLEIKLSQIERLKQNTPCQHIQMIKRCSY